VTHKLLHSYAGFVSDAVKHFTRSDGINYIMKQLVLNVNAFLCSCLSYPEY